MTNLLEDLTEIEYLIRQLYKIDSKLESGQFIGAYRDNRRVIARLESRRKYILSAQKEESDGNSDY